MLAQRPSETPAPPQDRRRSSITANMTSLINKFKGKGASNGKKKSPKSIPPEQVQQEPNGNFSERDGGEAMQMHNLARANKQCQKLVWSPDLAKDAQEYAKMLAEKGTMVHSGVQGQGENLYMSSGDAEYDQAVQSWLAEEKEYNGEKIGEGDFGKWGHFSQCLWHKTAHVGMGKATSENGSTYIVARYSPAGNMKGEKPF